MLAANIQKVKNLVKILEEENTPFTIQDIVELLKMKGLPLKFKEVEIIIRSIYSEGNQKFSKTEIFYNPKISGFRGAPPKILTDHPKYKEALTKVLAAGTPKGKIEVLHLTKNGILCIPSHVLLKAQFRAEEHVSVNTSAGMIKVSPCSKSDQSILLKRHYDTGKPRLFITKSMLKAAKLADKGRYLVSPGNRALDITI